MRLSGDDSLLALRGGSSLGLGSLFLLSDRLGLDGLDLGFIGASLAGEALLLAIVVLDATSFTLLLEFGDADLLGLHLVNGLHQHVLVLKLVTLGSEVELVVQVFVDLLAVTVAFEQATEDTAAAHGEDLDRHTGVLGTLAVAVALVAALALLSLALLDTEAGVNSDLGALDVTIFVELADVLAGVGKSDLAGLVRVNPNALLTALEDGGGKAPLQSEHSHYVLLSLLITKPRHSNPPL